MQTIEHLLREFINDNFLFGQGTDGLTRDNSFLEQGIIDSTGVLELVTFIEDRFVVKIADSELIPENLDSIDSLERFIERKLDEVNQPA